MLEMTTEYEHLRLLGVPDEQLGTLTPLLERGVYLTGRDGSSMADFMVQDLGLTPEFVEQNVQTVFLNYSPVDDFTTSRIHEGSVVALSAALPGLVGAVMRKSGFLASLRQGITKGGELGVQETGKPVTVRVKAFNLLLAPLSRLFFRKGVLLPMREAGELLRSLPDDFWSACAGVEIKGQRFDPRRYEIGLPEGDALLQLIAEAPEAQKGDA